jgi:uridylate kinase
MAARVKSLLLKLSGEALGGESGFGIEPVVVEQMCREIAHLRDAEIQLAVVLGGGNLFRGQNLAEHGMDRVVGDRMGMLATVMNGLAFADFLRRHDLPARVYSAFAIPGVVEGYNRDAAAMSMHAGEIVILSGGIGNPFFTTDTAACLRGIELGCDAVFKATNVDGVYSADPKTSADAQKFDEISYDDVLQLNLQVMDLTAIVLCKEHAMPLVVFDMNKPGALQRAAEGQAEGTRIVPQPFN